MPRAEKSHLGSQYYHSQFSNSQYLPDSSTSSGSPPMSPASSHPGSQTPSTGPSTSTSASSKKKHVCQTCERAFTTSGHLARHSRVHTGERNHKCPFPGCETRCSRQDNLQQHYRIHLSPGSRRSSARSGNARKRGTNTSSAASASSEPPAIPPPMTPPPLEQAHIYTHHSPPPDSPPPLAQATLPATAALPIPHSRMDGNSGRLSSSSSPDTSYATPNGPMHHMGSQGVGISHSAQLNYNYRSGTTTYQEQSQPTGAGYTSYVHTTPVSNPSASGSNGANNFASYGNSHSNFSNQPHNRNSPPAPMHSRHSISHINNPHYPPSGSNAAPASPASSHSVSSHTSAPPTPTYPVTYDDGQSFHHNGNGMVADHGNQMGPQSHIVHNGYTNAVPHASRFNSPPPTLAPIQNERYIRQEEPRHAPSHNTSPYIHHPQPLSNDYSYHQTMALGHGAWKTEGMRKGATVV
ncbi:hypothetical protein CPB83DRAFT_789183 [Crepidotus variabilis]|uniref:C2H2-type domain-containing protein n=1 Tax=Crepidotus variabilis TaxID=179855 RepID=A0A9P6EJJ2_9AGAR|nr:hypothetical protein CPB83DRAFT_789183 [Crepidotus variabilis]